MCRCVVDHAAAFPSSLKSGEVNETENGGPSFHPPLKGAAPALISHLVRSCEIQFSTLSIKMSHVQRATRTQRSFDIPGTGVNGDRRRDRDCNVGSQRARHQSSKLARHLQHQTRVHRETRENPSTQGTKALRTVRCQWCQGAKAPSQVRAEGGRARRAEAMGERREAGRQA